ncbi:MAG: bacillithiol biosynthesis cysteine-adding enzyme BshC [Firmicutes bacterium]|nr:bacillithiol biosynthesis cysteine-adding enzyme BshC [Bacillota bacterium]
MESHCISLHELPHISPLLSAFLEQFDRVAPFYAYPPTLEGVLASARAVAPDMELRRRVVEVLREQNRAFGSDDSVVQNLERLSAGAVAVVTGQQVSLFGGPAYSFYKALSAIALARQLRAASIEAVPVFWLATEDHDLAEVNHCELPGRDGLVRLELVASEGDRGRRVGEIALGQGIALLLERVGALLDGPAADHVARTLQESYRTGETYGSAFARLFARLLHGRGLVLLDPLEPRLHALTMPLYRRAIEQSRELRTALLARSRALEAAGFHPQVKVSETGTVLFMNQDGQRIPLRQRGELFTASGRSFRASQLLDLLDADPTAFTPNVLLRPVVQDWLLPTAAYVGGPAELAYFAQVEVLYRQLGVRMPAVVPRAGFTLVPPQVRRLLRRYGLQVEDVFAGRQSLRRMLERQFLSPALARQFDSGARAMARVLTKLRGPLAKLDPTLVGALETAQRKIFYQYEKLRAKAGRAENFRSGVLDRHAKLLWEFLYPHHGLQERTLSLLWFVALRGTDLFDELDNRAATRAQHQVLFL